MSATSRRPTVLLVDNAPAVTWLLINLLRNDYQVIHAIKGGDALELALRFEPDLILLDIVLPEVNGYEVCRRLKALPATSGIPVIILTTCSDLEFGDLGFPLGAVDCISMPFRISVLEAKVSRHLPHRQPPLDRRGKLM